MKTQTTLLILFVSFLTPVKASAEPFEVLPEGEVVFNVAATTSGIFTCLSYPAPIGGVPCIGSGTSSVTLGSGANTTTLTFHGIDSTFQAVGGNVQDPFHWERLRQIPQRARCSSSPPYRLAPIVQYCSSA